MNSNQNESTQIYLNISGQKIFKYNCNFKWDHRTQNCHSGPADQCQNFFLVAITVMKSALTYRINYTVLKINYNDTFLIRIRVNI